MLLKETMAQTCAELISQYAGSRSLGLGQRINLQGVDGKDVYNITAAFADRGEMIIAGRVEDRSTEFSQVVFFRQQGEVWTPHPEYPSYDMQDPFYTRIKGTLIVGGVRVIPDPLYPQHIVAWVTQFYAGGNIGELEFLMMGPYHMKDLRLIELADGAIGVLTRPQGIKGGRGKIGFFKAASYDEITITAIEEAPLFTGQFVDQEWGGANEAHLLGNGLVGVLGHIAAFDEEGNRHYYAMTFAFDPNSLDKTAMKLIAKRSDFPTGATKRVDLADVIFSGGLVRQAGGTAKLYVGASDAEAYVMEIPDPFLEYEQN